MTPDNEKRRDVLLRVEGVVAGTVAALPADGDPAWIASVLDSGIARASDMIDEYYLDSACDVACNKCGVRLLNRDLHVLWLGPRSARPARIVLCTKCHDEICRGLLPCGKEGSDGQL